MKCHIEEDWAFRKVKIWLYEPNPMNSESHFLAPDLDTMVPVPNTGEQPEPTLILDQRVAEALASALATMGRPEEATQRHLADAIKVRDRLLALVEKPWLPTVTAP